MIDAVKDYLAPKRFGVVAYVCLIVHFLCGLILIPVTSALRASEIGKFSCAVDTKSTAVYKIYVEKTCYSRYEQTYNSPVPLYGFVLLSIGLTVLVSVIYSLAVSSRVDEIDGRISNGSDELRNDGERTSNKFYVFHSYLIHLVARLFFGTVFTALQHTVFYPNGFDFKFSCSLPTRKAMYQIANNSSVAQVNDTSIFTTLCENSTASEKQLWGIIVSILSTVLSLIILGEVIYLCRRFSILNSRSEFGLSRDIEFIIAYLLRKPYIPVDVGLTSIDITSALLSTTPAACTTLENNTADNSLQNCIEFYKQQVLHPSRTGNICYAPETDLDDVYIDVLIHTGRAQHKFTKEMKRHEIYDVYMEVPPDSIRLEEIKDLFYPNEDTKDKFPRTILAVGRPGIGKTVLTEKIIRDWAYGRDLFYHDKIAFYFKFRWFNIIEELKNVSFKTFLRYGTGLSEEKFESIFEEISKDPNKAVFIFDGLDEFDGELNKIFDQSRGLLNDTSRCMSGINLFIKLAYGNFLPGATVLVTSRPTANDFYSKLNFGRSVEIIGFTSDKIKEYVSRFCENNIISDLKPKIWNHIESSSDLLNLCYIPVNAYIVCVTLSGCLINSSEDTIALPTTMTSLYQTAIDHLGKRHNTNLDETSSKQILKKLQNLAFVGMENGHLVFNEKRFDEQMRKSGLLNSLSNPFSPLQTQFCFIHLTIQEFLTAKQVVETLRPDEIQTFISTHIESGKWHLVLQFIAGLLDEKIKMSGGDYQNCVLAFGECIHNDKIDLNDNEHVCVIKCLKEVNDDAMVKEVCTKTALNHVATISKDGFPGVDLYLSDWEAVIFVCKHLNNVNHLFINGRNLKRNDCLELCKLLQQRCLETLHLSNFERGIAFKQQAMSAFFKSKCTLRHEHTKLRKLSINMGIIGTTASYLCTFIKNGSASHLQLLDLAKNSITSCQISQFCEVLNHELCSQLKNLDFSNNAIKDEGVRMLCNALINRHCKIKSLVLRKCRLTAECVHWLCKVLCDEHCQLADLSLESNDIGDKGVNLLCTDALRRDKCKLTKLSLDNSGLTGQCVPLLCETLQDRNCRLNELSTQSNDFTKHSESLLQHVQKVDIC